MTTKNMKINSKLKDQIEGISFNIHTIESYIL